MGIDSKHPVGDGGVQQQQGIGIVQHLWDECSGV